MKRTTGLLASFVGLAVIVFQPAIAAADVVPARKAKADRDAAAVEQRLATLGVDASTAKSSTERLTPSELQFFAEDSTRLQPVGGLTWYEFLGGVVVGTVVVLGLGLMAVHAAQ